MPISPYIHFQGNCREAMTAYQAVLGGKLDIMTYADMPGAPPGFGSSTSVLHSALMTPFGDIAASDFPPGMTGDPQQAMSVSLELPDMASGQRINDALAAGGVTIQAFGPSFFAPGFGMFKDRFGTHWIVTVTPQAN